MTLSHDVMVGIDVSKDKLDIAVTGQKVCEVTNNVKMVTQYFQKLQKKYSISRVVFEATGGYEKALLVSLESLEVGFARAHGTAVHHFMKARGQLGKTDAQDAYALLAYAEWMDEKAYKNGGISGREIRLQEWYARLGQLKKQCRAEKCRLKAPLLEQGIAKQIRLSIKFLERQIIACRKKLVEQIKLDSKLSDQFNRLQTMPGVGQETALAWACYGQSLTEGKRGSACAFCGVAPLNRDSGQHRGYRSTGHGQTPLKQMLYMAALVGVRHNKVLGDYYQGLLKRGKKPLVALIACSRKVLLWLRVMIRDGLDWQQMDVFKKHPSALDF